MTQISIQAVIEVINKYKREVDNMPQQRGGISDELNQEINSEARGMRVACEQLQARIINHANALAED